MSTGLWPKAAITRANSARSGAAGSDGGAFCAPGIPGYSTQLVAPGSNPTNPGCQTGLGITPTGGSAVSCSLSGGSACVNFGAGQFSAP